MNEKNEAIRSACLTLLEIVGESGFSADPIYREGSTRHLTRKAEEAQRALACHKRAISAWDALDVLMPGWVDVDVSDVLPTELWGAFVSNSRAEWKAWLLEHGVVEEQVEEILAEYEFKNE